VHWQRRPPRLAYGGSSWYRCNGRRDGNDCVLAGRGRCDARDGQGASLAALLGSTVYAAAISWQMQRQLPYSLRAATSTGMLAVVFMPLAWLKGDWPTNVALLAVAIVGYLVCLFGTRIVTLGEIAKVKELLRPGEPVAA
jgi:hypothetical protein